MSSREKQSEKISLNPMPVGFIRQYELADKVRAYAPDFDEDSLNRAYVYSMQAHGHQKRKSGDPYFTHPLAVAAILTELKVDPATVITALLHDTVEDTDTTLDDIKRLFGEEVASLVDGVTKLSKIELKSEETKQAENFGKLVMAMAKDMRVLLVKLADRLHNMRTLHHFNRPDKQRRIALETLEIYAPLAGRLAIHRFRDELEDLAFREINPEAYNTISTRLGELQTNTVKGVVELSQILRKRLESANIKAEIMSREKRPYSIWRKMEIKNISFEDLADIYAFRVVVDTIEDCYKVLGVIHTFWRVIPEEFDDYISMPKSNNYQSIHTAVVGPPTASGGRQRIELQIRTHTMHDHAERGAAAHWAYKQQVKINEHDAVRNMPATTDLIMPADYDPYNTPRNLQLMFQSEDPDEALKYAKWELFQDQVFCFTPNGRVISLPKGATPIDFAYAVHTDIGDSCVGAIVNGRQKPLQLALKNGDVVKILRSDDSRPLVGWENMAISGRARTAIRRRLKDLKYEEQVKIGRNVAENAFSGAKLDFSPKAIKSALGKLKMKSSKEVFAKIGRGDLEVSELIETIYPGAPVISNHEVRAANAGELVKARRLVSGVTPGFEGAIAECCMPVPGERIVGIKDQDTNEIFIHTIFCKSLAVIDPPQDSWVDLKWRDNLMDYRAPSCLAITVHNEVGGLSEIAAVIARYNISITNIRFISRTPDFFDLVIEVGVEDIRNLSQLITALRAIKTTISVERVEANYDESR